MSAIFTKQMLTDAEACSGQVAEFERLFGDSVVVTVAKARKVVNVFDWNFAAQFLDDEGRTEYERAKAPALAGYRRVTAPALAGYRRVTAAAWAEYDRAKSAAWAEYERVTAAAWAEYERVTAPALAEYDRAKAPAWAAAYIATCKRRVKGGKA